jgi:hypothetical protein
MRRWTVPHPVTRLSGRALGLPADMDASGLLPWAGVAEVAAALNLAPGQLLVDFGCGRGAEK